ncbi:MAG: RNA 2',3'-cyclic phosphodiesterase [Terriglobales bacterium]
MRLFVGLDLSDEIRTALAGAAATSGAAVGTLAWTVPADLHMTLQFLGEVGIEHEPLITRALRSVSCEPFALLLAGLDVFPDRRRPRVLWAGVEPTAALDDLVTRIDSVLGPLGFVREARRFHPHITLAKTRTPQMLAGLLPQLATNRPVWGRLPVETLVLFETDPTAPPGAPHYRRRAHFALARRPT